MEVFSYVPGRRVPIPDDAIELRISPFFTTTVVAGCSVITIPSGAPSVHWHGAPCTTFGEGITSVAVPFVTLVDAGVDVSMLAEVLTWDCVVGPKTHRQEDAATARRWLQAKQVHLDEIVGRLARFTVSRTEYVNSVSFSEVLSAMEPSRRVRCARDLADAVLERPDSLNRRFRKVLGCSLWTYAIRLRIAAARRSLLKTDDPLSEVAEAAGFTSAQAMTSAFRRMGALSPARYRRAGGGRLVFEDKFFVAGSDGVAPSDWRTALEEDKDPDDGSRCAAAPVDWRTELLANDDSEP